MDIRSFQELPPVLSNDRILFQAPVVISEKVYIPPALVALFHNPNVSLKALTLLFPPILHFMRDWSYSRRNIGVFDMVLVLAIYSFNIYHADIVVCNVIFPFPPNHRNNKWDIFLFFYSWYTVVRYAYNAICYTKNQAPTICCDK